MPVPRRRMNKEDDDAQRILAQYTYTMTSAPFLEMCTSVLRLDVRRALCGSRASQVRCVPLENGWDSNAMAPLIGQHSVSVTLLTNQLFVWVYLNQSGTDVTKRVRTANHPIEDEKSFPLMSNMTRYDEMKNYCGRLKMWSVLVSCTIAAAFSSSLWSVLNDPDWFIADPDQVVDWLGGHCDY